MRIFTSILIIYVVMIFIFDRLNHIQLILKLMEYLKIQIQIIIF
jgi:hypothetical protein